MNCILVFRINHQLLFLSESIFKNVIHNVDNVFDIIIYFRLLFDNFLYRCSSIINQELSFTIKHSSKFTNCVLYLTIVWVFSFKLIIQVIIIIYFYIEVQLICLRFGIFLLFYLLNDLI